MAKHTATPESILSNLSTEAVQVLESHFRQQVASEIASGLVGSPVAKTRRTASKGAPRGQRKVLEDGRNASQFIRDCEDSLSAKEVVVKAAELGLEISEALVYNVRANAKKKAARAENADAESAHQEEVRAKKLAALEKARAARAANAAARAEKANAATAAKPAKPAKK